MILNRAGFMFMLLLMTGIHLLADDGMWMPHQMKMLDLNQHGLEMDPDDLYKKNGTGLMSAVVHLGGGTGEFVSNQGLILTNHHVAFGAIQRASDTENDYITQGFTAWNLEEEIPAQGYYADVLLGYKDVTKKVLSAVKKNMSLKEKYEAIDRRKKELVAKEEARGEDIRCKVSDMYSGNAYYLFRFKHLEDIRLVYAPPRDLGNFGGDIDNWMWPRHTCDFTFLRAYVSKENVGAPYSEDNVPYRPKSVLKIAKEGLKAGDFTFVMGYPGRTYRNYTYPELLFSLNRMRRSVDDFQSTIDFLVEAGKKDRQVEIRYASKVKGLNNALKNYQGKIEGMERVDLPSMKARKDQDFLQWVKEDSKRNQRFGRVLQEMTAFMNEYEQFYWKERRLSNLVNARSGPTLLGQAHTIVRAATEFQKPDMEREAYYQDRNRRQMETRMKLADRGYTPEVDRRFFSFLIRRDFQGNEASDPQALKEILASENLDQVVNRLYDNSRLQDTDYRLSLLNKTPDELKEVDDSLIQLALKLEEELAGFRDSKKRMEERLEAIKKEYIAGKLAMEEGHIAPDANSTIRFTYGTVEGYSPRDAIYYQPFTTLKGLLDKETGEFPFHVPEKLKQLHQDADFGEWRDPNADDVVTCFLNTTNVTGGNSGSPTLNARGEQVGIIFDMTYESVIGDYYVIPDLQRTISVDIRFVLFVTQKFSSVHWILQEMGIE